MKAERFAQNPLIKPSDVKPTRDDFEVICVFNPAVVRFKDEILLLMRVAERPIAKDLSTVPVPILSPDFETGQIDIVELSKNDPALDFSDPRVVTGYGDTYLTSISHLRLARSKDGRHFDIDEETAIFPDRPAEAFGVEDARITEIDGIFYVVYKSVSPNGICQSLAITHDFVSFEKKGVIIPPENMDGMMFPAKIGGKFVLLHRPYPHMIGHPSMWTAYSNDGLSWGDHRFIAGVSVDGWESGRIGGGAVPFMTERGWLEIYHGATPDHRYSLGAILLDAEHPEVVLGRSPHPILEPEADYEVNGFVPNVVFSCGAVVDGDRLTVYYGAADTVIAGAELSVTEILDSLV